MSSKPFAGLLARRAPADEIAKWFWPFLDSNRPTDEDWADLVVPVASAVDDLNWMTDQEKNQTQSLILRFVQRAFTELLPPVGFREKSIREALNGFNAWIESLPDATVVTFCWHLLEYDRSLTPEPVWWLHRSGRLAGPISYDNLRLAVSLADEAEAMYWRKEQRWKVVNWERDSQPYWELLSHSSYLVRPAAAKVLGSLYYGLCTHVPEYAVPELADILGLIQQREIETPGVAGPFLQGTQWGYTADAPWRDNHLDMKG